MLTNVSTVTMQSQTVVTVDKSIYDPIN